MARKVGSLNRRPPKLCRHKASGRAYVTIGSREIPLGSWPDATQPAPPDIQAKYHAAVAESLSGGTAPAGEEVADLTVADLIARFWVNAKRTRGPQDLKNFQTALRALKHLYGDMHIEQFSPMRLAAVRDYMARLPVVRTFTFRKGNGPTRTREVSTGQTWTRGYVNSQLARIKQVFEWGDSIELTGELNVSKLSSVPALVAGEKMEDGFVPREGRTVRPVAERDVFAVLPYVSREVAALIELQWLTGMRSTEACTMRVADIDMTPNALGVWRYTPVKHKSQKLGFDRVVPLGRRAKEIVGNFLTGDPSAYLFRPGEAEAARLAAMTSRARVDMPASVIDGKGYRCPHCKTFRSAYAGWVRDHVQREHADTDLSKAIDAALRWRQTEKGTGWKRKHQRRRRYRDCYEQHVYNSAVRRGIRRANAAMLRENPDVATEQLIPTWHPHRLRHSAGTRVRKECGAEASRVLLGHRRMSTTEIYAEQDRSLADKAMAAIG